MQVDCYSLVCEPVIANSLYNSQNRNISAYGCNVIKQMPKVNTSF